MRRPCEIPRSKQQKKLSNSSSRWRCFGRNLRRQATQRQRRIIHGIHAGCVPHIFASGLEVPALKAQIAGVEVRNLPVPRCSASMLTRSVLLQTNKAQHAALQDATASAELHQKLERLQEEAAQAAEIRKYLCDLGVGMAMGGETCET